MNPPSPQQSHVISQQVFGSSKKLQFIGISPMDSLLTAIDHQTQQTKSATPPKTMSIESLLDTNGDTSLNNKRRYPSGNSNNNSLSKVARRKPNSGTTNGVSVPVSSSLPTTSASAPTATVTNNDTSTLLPASVPQQPHLRNPQMTTLTCYHASVAQKSYGSEKRFLCPPPVVRIHSPDGSNTFPSLTPCTLTMSVINENGDRHLEQQAVLDDDQCTFKYLHVTGTAKAKQFSLSVSISGDNTVGNGSTMLSSPSSSPPPPQQQQNNNSHPYATFLSNPISIISKPSKKTAKTRNVSTCILSNRPISLFNRINSQTVRTKYMTSEMNQLCAKNGRWSPFEIIILNQPQHYQTIQRPSSSQNNTGNNSSNSSNSSSNNSNVIPLIYGSELILRDTQTGVRSQPVVIRKVDKGRIVPGAYGPVSQMQKIALQLVTRSHSTNSRRGRSMYLSAMGVTEATGSGGGNSGSGVTPAHSPHTTLLDYAGSYMVPEGLDAYEKVDDYLCWTIVGISTFEYSFYDNHLQSPVTTSPRTASTTSTLPLSQSSNGHQYPSNPEQLNTSSSPLPSPSASPLPLSLSLSSSSSISSSSSSTSINSPRPTSSSSTLPAATKLKSRCLTPFPSLTSIHYDPSAHTLDIVGQHFMQAVPSPKLLELWLGSHHGPLHTTIQPQPKQPHETHLIVNLPPTQDLIVANHDRLSPGGGNRTLELPLFLVREDGVVYHLGKSLACEVLGNGDAGLWYIVDVRQ
ncbi:hypothetical protein [Absidia glauca]|uniref:Uncharacterized protein n=1 Tax=Absidia glauca TaxID=4829 RepID=A0A163J9U2_ABSGL|nr:hypothetical protein [Absidia glauca]